MTTTPAVSDIAGGVTLDRGAIDAFQEASPDGSSDFVDALVDQYLREATLQVATIAGAARSLDGPRIKASAHSLKGSSLVMGALRLAALCARLEDHVVAHPDAVVTSETTAAIEQELVRVRDAFASVGQS
jgi:HPt (histidine-containing phosphotransfer) domain-containing protein